MSKHCNNVTPTERLSFIEKDPIYHCKCEYCTKGKFLGEIFNSKENKYYSQIARKKYYPKIDNKKFPHNNPGHWPGYRFAIHNLTKEGDIVFDPTVGTGTAIVEAENNNRIGVGIELEFPETTKYMTENRGTVISGNALTVDPKTFLEKDSIQLLINGTPYLTFGSQSSDAPFGPKDQEQYGDYKHTDNIGKWKEKYYKKHIHKLYTRYIPYIKEGGYLCIIIKDPTNNKKPYNLHKLIIDNILENNPEMVHYGSFVHRHIPTTFFMNTYEKINNIPLKVWHQTAIILKKIEKEL